LQKKAEQSNQYSSHTSQWPRKFPQFYCHAGIMCKLQTRRKFLATNCQYPDRCFTPTSSTLKAHCTKTQQCNKY